MPFRISYGEDVLKAKRVLQDVFATDSRVLQTPPSEVYVKKHGDSSINLLFRVWVKQAVYWAYFLICMSQVKLGFDREGSTIPFRQRDVHMIPAAESA